MSNRNTPYTHWALLSVALGAVTGCGGTVDPSRSDESLPIDTMNEPSHVESTEDPSASRGESSMVSDPPTMDEDDEVGVPLVNDDFLAYDVFSASGVERDIKLKSVDGLCSGELVSTDADEKQPAFSPDMTLLAYASNESGQFQIHLLDLISGESRQLTTEPGGATFPSFSPSGELVAFVSGDPDTFREQGTAVGVIDVESEGVRTIDMSSSGFRAPTFSTESEILVGNAIVLLGLNLVDETERAVVPLTSRIPNPQDPSVAPDGERYVFTDYCNGGQRLFVGRVDGTTGDTCAAALPLDNSFGSLVSASWGPSGVIAAHSPNGEVVLLAEDGSSSSVLLTGGVPKNPEFSSGPLPFEVVESCLLLRR